MDGNVNWSVYANIGAFLHDMEAELEGPGMIPAITIIIKLNSMELVTIFVHIFTMICNCIILGPMKVPIMIYIYIYFVMREHANLLIIAG